MLALGLRWDQSLKGVICLLVFVFFMLASSRVHAYLYQERLSLAKGLAHYAMGQMYDLLDLTDRAILEYEKASQSDESSYLTHLRLGVDYARMDMLSDAKTELESVYRYNPDDLQSHYLLALIHSTQKDYDLAAEEYEVILKKYSKVDPSNIDIYAYLGQLYYSQKKYDKAIVQFKTLNQLEPKNTDVMYVLGSLYLELDQDDQAMDILKRALLIDPKHDGCLNTLGYIYADNNIKLDESEQLLRRALILSPENGAYLDSLGWVFYKKGQYEDALKTLKQADSIVKDPVIYDHLAEVYLKLKDFEQALIHWGLALELHPDQENIKKKIEEVKNIQASKQ